MSLCYDLRYDDEMLHFIIITSGQIDSMSPTKRARGPEPHRADVWCILRAAPTPVEASMTWPNVTCVISQRNFGIQVSKV